MRVNINHISQKNIELRIENKDLFVLHEVELLIHDS
jgi:hypothetical protein